MKSHFFFRATVSLLIFWLLPSSPMAQPNISSEQPRTTPSEANERIKSRKHGFSLRFSSSDWKESPAPDPSVLLLLHSTSPTNYPTANLILSTDPLRGTNRSLSYMGKKLLSSYRGVGLTDTDLLDIDYIELSRHTAVSALLRYTLKGRKMKAHVVAFPLLSGEGVLTFVAPEELFEQSLSERTKLLEALAIAPSVPASGEQISDIETKKRRLWFSLGSIVLMLGLYLAWRRFGANE